MEEHKEKKEHHQKDAKSGEAAAHHGAGAGRKEIRISVPEIKGINLNTITTAATVILLLIVLFQAYQANSLSNELSKMVAEAEERNRAASIEVTAISADCADCLQVSSVLEIVRRAKVSITDERTLSPNDEHAKTLIRQYGIERLPTVVIKGEIDSLGIAGFTRNNDALVFTQTQPPYVDAATGSVKGLVTLTYVNASSCGECPDLMPAVQQLRSIITVKSVNVVDKDSPEGKKIVGEYAMSRLPGILVSSDAAEYPIAAELARTGTVKKDGSIALGANPPYFNTSTGKVDGIASLIMLNDSSCTECYDVTIHLPIVKSGFQVYLGSTKAVDASSAEGKELVSKYSITAVPTILITGDVSVYTQLAAVWGTVGTVEKDGAYVFRNMAAIAGRQYKNLTTGKVELNTVTQQQ